MKAGIITYTSAQNWGGQLQAYSLNEYINTLGVKCELINYKLLDKRLFKPKKEIKDILYSLLLYNANKQRIQRFEDFRKKELHLTEKVYTTVDELRELNEYYDCFITGSDQLWNCETEINYPFYLRFVNESKKKIAYAPSFGSDSIPQKFESEVTALLSRYDSISVREKSGAEIVRKLLDKDIPIVVDPVFLHTKAQWIEKLHLKPVQSNEPFIFVYTTEKSSQINKIVREFHKNNPAYLVYTPFAIPGVKATVLKDIGPIEFLEYILGSDYVIGNSFHAIAFSLLFRKPFCAVKHSTRFARVRDLLEELELMDKVYNDGYIFDFRINDKYTSKLNDMIAKSKEYLKKALEE